MHRFQHGGGSAVGIDRAIHPGIAMVPRDHALLRQLAAGDFADDIPDAAIAIILLQMHFYPHRPWPYVIGERQAALPGTRRIGPGEILQDGLGVGVGNRCGGNLGKRRRTFRRGAFGVR